MTSTPDPVGDAERPDRAGADTPAAESAPRDERPLPRYGELAPPGWKFVPPEAPPSAVAPVQAPASTPAPESKPKKPPRLEQHAGAAPDAGAESKPQKLAPSWDRPLTVGLLVVGLYGLYVIISGQSEVTSAMATLYAQYDLGDYKPAASVPTIILIANIVQVVLWFIAAALSIMLLLRRRRAFWVPLLVGVLAFVAFFAFLGALLLSDPSLVEQLGKAGL